MEEVSSRISNLVTKMYNYYLNMNTYGAINRHRHIAVLFKGSQILSYGVNHSRECLGGCHVPTVHAECCAIHHYLRQHRIKTLNEKTKRHFKNIEILAIRISFDKTPEIEKRFKNRDIGGSVFLTDKVLNSTIKNSKPCIHCLNIIQKSGISKVHYSNENGDIVSEECTNIRPTISEGFLRQHLAKKSNIISFTVMDRKISLPDAIEQSNNLRKLKMNELIQSEAQPIAYPKILYSFNL